MNTLCGLRFCRAVAVAMWVAVTITVGNADESVTAAGDDSKHPASSTVRFLTSRYDYIRNNIRDFACRQIKRERINGQLQEYQFARTRVRCELRKDGRVAQPLSVFMHYYAPASLEDRRVLYIDGQNEGMMQVRKGGRVLPSIVLVVDPLGDVAKVESNYPITDNSFDRIVGRLIQQVNNAIKHDPTGANTQVSYFGNARVDDRVCTHIQLVHPERETGIKYHKSSWYFDDELHVPLRIVNYGWPQREGEEPPVIEEYMYVDLRINVGLTDADFSKSKLN